MFKNPTKITIENKVCVKDEPSSDLPSNLAPGDFCEMVEEDQCATLEASCVNNVCVTKNKNGD